MSLPDYMKSLQSIINGTPSGNNELLGSLIVPTSSSEATPSSEPKTSTEVSLPVSTEQNVAPGEVKGEKKLKFMLVSTHCHQYTGYSKVSWGIIKQLSKIPWLHVTHYAFQKFPNQQFTQGYRPYPSNIDVIDAASLEKPFEQGFGFKHLPDAIRKVKPDVVMIYNDMSVVAKFLIEIEKSGIPNNHATWVYCDQVYNTQSQGFLDMLNMKVERIFAFSNGWKKCLKDQGINRPIDVLLHGFETDVYKPLPKMEIRKKMNIPENAFVFLNVNRNQPRKRYDLLIMAFVELIVKYPTKPLFLLCICDKGEKGGWWLFEIFTRELKMRGVPLEHFGSRLMLSSQDMTFKDEDINLFYNMADAGVNAADGEGWGLCNFEQMGVGVPQVVPNIGGFKEFCNKDNSVLVDAKNRYYLPSVYSPVGGEANAVDPHDLCMGMETYVLDTDKRLKHGEEAKKTVLSYTWERAVEPLVRRLKQVKEDKDAESS
jgi:glycosyltransferase involved in cell wall biosynthesis